MFSINPVLGYLSSIEIFWVFFKSIDIIILIMSTFVINQLNTFHPAFVNVACERYLTFWFPILHIIHIGFLVSSLIFSAWTYCSNFFACVTYSYLWKLNVTVSSKRGRNRFVPERNPWARIPMFRMLLNSKLVDHVSQTILLDRRNTFHNKFSVRTYVTGMILNRCRNVRNYFCNLCLFHPKLRIKSR